MQLPFFSQRKYHPLARQGSARITVVVLPFPPSWNSLIFLVFLLLPKTSPHILTALLYLLWLSPFLWFLTHSHCYLLLFPPHTSLGNKNPDPTLAFVSRTSDDTWSNLAPCSSSRSSLLPLRASLAITAHGNTPNLNASLHGFSLFPWQSVAWPYHF